jgi:F0F1-type ATP synthase assembly protein I
MAESSSVTIFNSPILSTGILCKVGFAKLLDALAFLKSYALIIIAVVGLCTAVCMIDGPH